MSDTRYEYWHNALEGRLGAITEDQPQAGFYRKKGPGGFWLPVAIWFEQDDWWVQIGKEDLNGAADHVRETWVACAKQPISEKDYRHAVATGQWPGEAPAEARGLGDNKPPQAFDALVERINEEANKAQAWLKDRKIATQADADRCETWTNEFLKLRKQAETEHKVEKAPHLEAGRKVDAKYKPLIDRAAEFARALKGAVTPYLIARQKEKEMLASQSIAKGEASARIDTRATTSGASGRKVSLRTVKFAIIEDWKAATLYFLEHDNPELRELVQRLADKCAQVNAPVPGVKFDEDKKAA